MSPAKLWIGRAGLGFALVVAVVVALALIAGCGSSALDNSTTTLGTFRAGQAGVVKSLELGLELDLVEHCGEAANVAEREECARARAEEWRTVEEGMAGSAATLDALALGLLAWAERVAANVADENDPPLPVCDALARLADVAVSWARFGGVTLPVEPWECPERGEP